jgi:hypothetical protein
MAVSGVSSNSPRPAASPSNGPNDDPNGGSAPAEGGGEALAAEGGGEAAPADGASGAAPADSSGGAAPADGSGEAAPVEGASAPAPTAQTSEDARVKFLAESGGAIRESELQAQVPEGGAAPAAETDPAIAPERQEALDGYVESTAQEYDAGDRTAAALTGESDLGTLSTGEQEYLVDKSLDTWLPPTDPTAGAEAPPQNYTAVQQLAMKAGQDPALSDVVLPAYAERASELVATAPPDAEGYDQRRQASTLATEAVLNAPSDEAVRGLVEDLGPEGASQFTDALGLDADNLYASSEPSTYGGSSGLEERVVAADRLLGAVATGEPTPASQAVTAEALLTFDGKAFDSELVGDLGQSMGKAVAQHWYPEDPAYRDAEAARFGEMFQSERGRQMFFPEGLPPGSRVDALNTFAAHPEWNQSTLDSYDGNPWTNPTITKELAQPLMDRALTLGTDQGRVLSGSSLENTVGLSMGIPPGEASGSPQDPNYYGSEAAAGIVDPIADQIRNIGGTNPEVTVLPVVYSSPESGTVELPLYRVRNPETGVEGYVDNIGREYESFEEWRTTNALPSGNMTHPADGHLVAGPDGSALTESANTPQTTDTPIEHAKEILDHAALVGGVAAGGLILAGTGGAAAPVVGAAASAWGAYRAGESLADRAQHGQSLNPIEDPGARADWVNLGVNALGLGGLGLMKVGARLSGARGLGAVSAVDDLARGALPEAAAVGTDSGRLLTLRALRPPNVRHYAGRVTQSSRAAEKNSVFEPWVPAQDDVSAIRSGKATYSRGQWLVNGRVYAEHDGTLYPVSGAGVHELDRSTYKALGVYNSLMDTPNAARIPSILGNMGVTEAQAQAAWELHLMTRRILPRARARAV